MCKPNIVRVKVVGGQLQMVYSDGLAGLMAKGETRTVRASHVEPDVIGGGWLADMRPVGGPIIATNGQFVSAGSYPVGVLTQHGRCDFHNMIGFPTRQAALDAEVAYLHERFGL